MEELERGGISEDAETGKVFSDWTREREWCREEGGKVGEGHPGFWLGLLWWVVVPFTELRTSF